MLTSRIQPVGAVAFPQYRNAQLYMHKFDTGNPSLPQEFADFEPLFKTMVSKSPIKSGEAFATIDCRRVAQGESHRRTCIHESLPLSTTVNRMLMRITLPDSQVVL